MTRKWIKRTTDSVGCACGEQILLLCTKKVNEENGKKTNKKKNSEKETRNKL